jgi:hypothetical protein
MVDGVRMFGRFEEGTWMEETERRINGGVLHGKLNVFPFFFYLDETFLTREGTFKAKPVFVQAGDGSLA